MAEGTSPKASPTFRNPPLCDECGLNPWKYRCPGCSIRSCSLPCVNSHKKRTRCTAKRSCTEVVPLSQFDDKLLLSDYSLLEETKRVIESAMRKSSGFPRYSCFKLTKKLQMLCNAANQRRIRLLISPDGMSKRRNNRSRYDKRRRSIFWTVQLRFHGTDVSIFHHGVDECGSLLYIFRKHLAPSPWKHKLRPFYDVQLDDLKLFLQKNPNESKSPYRKLDINMPIGSQFEDIMILEYPVIFIYLPTHDYDFEVETGRMPPSAHDDVPTPSALYKMEEVEEGDEASDTRVTDLMERSKSEDAHVPSSACLTKEEVKTDNAVHGTDKQIPEKSDGGVGYYPCDENIPDLTPNSFESVDAGFYFEQEVRDAYTDLVGEMNPDDFLCLDGVCIDGDDLGEASWYGLVEGERVDTIKISNGELDQLTGYAFDTSEGSDLGEGHGNKYFKENFISNLEEREGNALKKRRGNPEEKKENFFFANEDPFGEIELEEGEIPFFMC